MEMEGMIPPYVHSNLNDALATLPDGSRASWWVSSRFPRPRVNLEEGAPAIRNILPRGYKHPLQANDAYQPIWRGNHWEFGGDDSLQQVDTRPVLQTFTTWTGFYVLHSLNNDHDSRFFITFDHEANTRLYVTLQSSGGDFHLFDSTFRNENGDQAADVHDVKASEYERFILTVSGRAGSSSIEFNYYLIGTDGNSVTGKDTSSSNGAPCSFERIRVGGGFRTPEIGMYEAGTFLGDDQYHTQDELQTIANQLAWKWRV